jgi:hypothetical protein
LDGLVAMAAKRPAPLAAQALTQTKFAKYVA